MKIPVGRCWAAFTYEVWLTIALLWLCLWLKWAAISAVAAQRLRRVLGGAR